MSRPDTELEKNPSEFHEEWLSAYLDDELSEEQRGLVEQRLESDPAARQLLDDLEQVRRLVINMPGWMAGNMHVDVNSLSKSEKNAAAEKDAAATEVTSQGVPHAVEAVEELSAHAPTAEEQVAEEPIPEQPTTEQPIPEQPTAEQPTAEQPTAEEPAAEKLGSDELGSETQRTETQRTETQRSEEPIVEQRVAQPFPSNEVVAEEGSRDAMLDFRLDAEASSGNIEASVADSGGGEVRSRGRGNWGTWWKPLTLAVSVLAMLGVGIMLWNSGANQASMAWNTPGEQAETSSFLSPELQAVPEDPATEMDVVTAAEADFSLKDSAPAEPSADDAQAARARGLSVPQRSAGESSTGLDKAGVVDSPELPVAPDVDPQDLSNNTDYFYRGPADKLSLGAEPRAGENAGAIPKLRSEPSPEPAQRKRIAEGLAAGDETLNRPLSRALGEATRDPTLDLPSPALDDPSAAPDGSSPALDTQIAAVDAFQAPAASAGVGGDGSSRVAGRAAPPSPGFEDNARLKVVRSSNWRDDEVQAALAEVYRTLGIPNADRIGPTPDAEPSGGPGLIGGGYPLSIASLNAGQASQELFTAVLTSSPTLTRYGIGSSPRDDKSQLSEEALGRARSSNDTEVQAPIETPTNAGLAFFVQRSQAEQILARAQRDNLLKSSPMWIESLASGSAPSDPNEKVILLLKIKPE